ncbi:SDR family NAD(P)-dependent oxidoreductase [Rhodococcus sp. NPDC127528]|uniref:SDR family NAD(P)-dependent oxidoreductase n=1 Tax=unclassified Rhodococcus (in: high G+C Gram-positive bacteria) TaxID=192944 RepID=UPI00362DFEAA
MILTDRSALVTGGASGLGRASAEALVSRGVPTVILDLPHSDGEIAAKELGALATFAPADILDTEAVENALDVVEQSAPLGAVIHCAGGGHGVRVVDKNGAAGDLELFTDDVERNLVGTFNVLRLAATRMARNEPVDGERGVVVMTSSIAAFEGRIGQASYSAAKAGVTGLTLVAARDLASRLIRVATIAPGVFDTPLLGLLSEERVRRVPDRVPHPARLGRSAEFAQLALAIVGNPMINGETIRIDGAIRG